MSAFAAIVLAIGIYNAGLAIARGIVNAERLRQGQSLGKE
ncbi:hypothetical protein ACVIHC_002215 [Bradyrhizobium diazoefficiens]